MLVRALIGLVLLGCLPATALADGEPDPSFNHGQSATFAPQRFSVATGGAVDAQGRILVSAIADDGTLLHVRATVLRLLPDGSLDPSFGVAGVATVEPPAPYTETTAESMALDAAGRIVIAGEVDEDVPAVMRLLADGAPDPSFGAGGIVVARGAYAGAPAWWQSVALSGSSIVVGGMAVNSPPYGTGLDRVAVLARFDDAGAPDPSFGSGGFVALPGTGATVPRPQSLAIDPGGRIVLGMSHSTSTTPPIALSVQVVRLTTQGALDPSFGAGGVVLLGPLRSAVPNVIVRPTGEIVAIGGWGKGAVTGPATLAAQLLPNGRLDSAFATGGQITEPQPTSGRGMLDCSGNLIVSGPGGVRRFGLGGRLDPTFTTMPQTTVPIGSATGVVRQGLVAIAAGGAIVLAGSASDGPTTLGGPPGTQVGNTVIVVSRLLATCPIADTAPPTVTLHCTPGCRRVGGTAVDDPVGSGVRRILVGIVRRIGNRCAVWNEHRFLPLSCTRAARFRFAFPFLHGTFRGPRLGAGSFVVRAVAVDRAGNLSRVAIRGVTH